MKTLGQLNIGEKISGTAVGKFYTFAGIQKYSGRGRYPHLKGKDVIVIQSNERKRWVMILFLEPLLMLLNADFEDLRHGKLPADYIKHFRSGDPRRIPNIYEYESHYKSIARYIKGLTTL